MIRILWLHLFLFSCLTGLSQEMQNWNQFRGNQQLTGVSDSRIPSNIEIKWTFHTGSQIKSSPVISGQRIIIGSTNGNLYCLDLSGALLWKRQTGNAIEAPAMILKEKVYVGNLDGTLFCLDLSDGSIIWTYQTDNQIMGAPNWYRNGNQTYILVGSYDFYLHCVNAEKGTGVWKYELDNYLNSTVSVDGHKGVFGGCDGFLHIVNLQNGRAREKIEIASYIAGSPALENEIAYVGDYDGGVTCVDLQRQRKCWKWNNDQANLPFIASPAVYRDNMFLTSRDKFVYCFDKKNGSLRWKRNTGFRIDASPLVTKSGLLVANMRGDLQLLNLYDGKLLWNYEIGSPVFSNPAVYDNRIFLGAGDGLVYCIGK